MEAIFVDAGHGRSLLGLKDVGAVGKFGAAKYYERVIAVELARRVLDILKTKTELKGTLVQGVGVETEANISRKMKYVNTVLSENRFIPSRCLGISIHMNASTSNKPRGFEVWYQRSGKPRSLAEYIVRAWKKYDIVPLRPSALNSTATHRYKKLYIDDTLCPWVLIETAFISNLTDVTAIMNNLDRAAEAIAHGVLEFIRGN